MLLVHLQLNRIYKPPVFIGILSSLQCWTKSAGLANFVHEQHELSCYWASFYGDLAMLAKQLRGSRFNPDLRHVEFYEFLWTQVIFGGQCGSVRYTKHLKITSTYFSLGMRLIRKLEGKFPSRLSRVVCSPAVVMAVPHLYYLATVLVFMATWSTHVGLAMKGTQVQKNPYKAMLYHY